MKNKTANIICITVGLVMANHACLAQGFINLNFEQAQIVVDPSGMYPDSVYASNAIPGWTAYFDGVPQTSIIYNDVSLGAASVSIQDANGAFPSIAGAGYYTILLQGIFGNGMPGYPNTAAIGQTGLIPTDAQSLIFWGAVGQNDVSFAGQTLSLVILGSTANYAIYGADISSFAGQTGQLLFTALPNEWDVIANIQFSSNPVPEPGTWALLGMGSVAFILIRRHGQQGAAIVK